ncbi:serine/threonine-protein kinase dyf-5-like [Oratosquilla oratoria]|uniref:serine/threonine-protein kinase dyf-5-like n=1 Tax=Oratosquilla oratoria TaxID=337810 RepID=UPI003F761819
MYDRLNTEIASFRALGRHPNVIYLQEVIREEENHLVYFVLDIMDLSLEDTVKRMAEQGLSFTESEVKSVWFQCLKGLRHVHKVGLVHCDLAARNIRVNRTGSVKITDFGLAIREGENVFFSQKEDLIDLGAVFIYSVSQEEVDQIDLIHGKISSSGVQLIE